MSEIKNQSSQNITASGKMRIHVPQGLDAKLVQRVCQQVFERRKRRFAEASRKFSQKCRMEAEVQQAIAKANGKAGQVADQVATRKARALHDLLRRTKAKAVAPPRGHNPVRYPPFDVQGQELNYSVGTIEYDPFGPDVTLGKAGANLAAWQSSRGTSGMAMAETAVGIVYRAESTGTLSATVQAYVLGYRYLYAPLSFSVAQGWGQLTAWIEDAATSKYAEGITTIGSFSVMGGVNSGYLDGYYSVRVSYPVKAERTYLILPGSVQSVFAMPDCDAQFDTSMYIDSIKYQIS